MIRRSQPDKEELEMSNESLQKNRTPPPGLEGWKPIRNTMDLVERIEKDPWLQEQIKQNPARAIAQVSGPPLETDVWIYRLVVVALGLTVLIAVVGAIILASMGEGDKGRDIPEILVAIGSAAVGALAGLLAPSPSRKSD